MNYFIGKPYLKKKRYFGDYVFGLDRIFSCVIFKKEKAVIINITKFNFSKWFEIEININPINFKFRKY